MTDFIRAEARATLWRWRDVMIAAAIVTLGLWWMIEKIGVLRWIGIGLVVLGAAIAYSGVQRARFGRAKDGPGVVQVVERRIGYFGPTTGGALDLADLRLLTLENVAQHDLRWVLTADDHPTLTIPVGAKGGDVLFDVFASLPGMQTARMVRLLDQPPAGSVTVWQRSGRLNPRTLLH